MYSDTVQVAVSVLQSYRGSGEAELAGRMAEW